MRVVAMPVEETGVADLVGAASLLVSQTALESVAAIADPRNPLARIPSGIGWGRSG